MNMWNVHFSQVLIADFKGEATALILWDSDLSLSSFPESCQLGQGAQTSLKHTQCEQHTLQPVYIYWDATKTGRCCLLSDADLLSSRHRFVLGQSLSPKEWEGQTFCPNIWCFHDCGFNWKCLLFIKTQHLQSHDFKVDKRRDFKPKGDFCTRLSNKTCLLNSHRAKLC